jgi:hypothetical protein
MKEAELKAGIKRLVKANNLLKGVKFNYIDYTEKENFNPNLKPITYTIKTNGHFYRYNATYEEFYSLLIDKLKEQTNKL